MINYYFIEKKIEKYIMNDLNNLKKFKNLKLYKFLNIKKKKKRQILEL